MKAMDCKINGSDMGVVSKVSRSKLYGSKSSIVVSSWRGESENVSKNSFKESGRLAGMVAEKSFSIPDNLIRLSVS